MKYKQQFGELIPVFKNHKKFEPDQLRTKKVTKNEPFNAKMPIVTLKSGSPPMKKSSKNLIVTAQKKSPKANSLTVKKVPLHY